MKRMIVSLALSAVVGTASSQQRSPNIEYDQISRNSAAAQTAWQTIRESNIRAAQVQKQYGHQEWKSTYNVVVQTPANNSGNTLRYHYGDEAPTVLNNQNTAVQNKITQVEVTRSGSSNDLRQENRSVAVVKVMPNPSTDGRFTIQLPDGNTLYNIRLIGAHGTVVQQWNAITGTNYSITVQHPGTYILHLMDRNNLLVSAQKVIFSR